MAAKKPAATRDSATPDNPGLIVVGARENDFTANLAEAERDGDVTTYRSDQHRRVILIDADEREWEAVVCWRWDDTRQALVPGSLIVNAAPGDTIEGFSLSKGQTRQAVDLSRDVTLRQHGERMRQHDLLPDLSMLAPEPVKRGPAPKYGRDFHHRVAELWLSSARGDSTHGRATEIARELWEEQGRRVPKSERARAWREWESFVKRVQKVVKTCRDPEHEWGFIGRAES